jgi:dienelactone hydrolase
MAIQSRAHDYSESGVSYEARICWDDACLDPRPAVLVSHAWRGRTDFENAEAEKLARMGYVGFALDLYGTGVIGSSPEQNRRLMQPYMDDRQKLQRHMLAALREVRTLPQVDTGRVAAIGFCFGGLCVLDLARCGSDVRGVASFHGLLTPAANLPVREFHGGVLVLHGWDDPLATPQELVALGQELTELGADWQIHAYGNTLHAFSNPLADDAAHGLKFDVKANDRARRSLNSFLREIFG